MSTIVWEYKYDDDQTILLIYEKYKYDDDIDVSSIVWEYKYDDDIDISISSSYLYFQTILFISVSI